MPDFPTFTEFQRVIRDEALSKNDQLSALAFERDGSDANIIAAAAAAGCDEVVGQLADVSAGLFLDSSEGHLLDRLVFDRYGLVRKLASPALGSVEFRTLAANPAAFTIPAGTVVQTADGVQFITTGSAVFPTSSTGPIVAAVRSTLAGSNQQAGAGTITSIVGQIPGSAVDLYVTNTLATAGADDDESDASLRDRARRFFTTARRGTLAAIEAGALAVPGVRKATALEVIDSSGRGARLVQLVVADAFTDVLASLGESPPAYQAQSQQLALLVFNSLSDVRAGGIFVQVLVAKVVLQPITLNLRFAAGFDVDTVALIARATVSSYVAGLTPGQTLQRSALTAALRTVPGLPFVGDEVVSPAGDVIPKPLEVIRAPMAVVSVLSAQADVLLSASGNPDFFTIVGGG